MRLLGTLYHLLGQGLIGGGIATLYFSVFAAVSFYHLIDAYPAFALMALVTVAAGVMAVRFDSLLIAVLGIIGGYGTPILLSTGEVNFVGLLCLHAAPGVRDPRHQPQEELAPAQLPRLRLHLRPVRGVDEGLSSRPNSGT